MGPSSTDAEDSDFVPYWVRRSAPGGTYDKMIDMGIAMGEDALGSLEPGVSIVIGEHFGGHQRYVRPNQKPILVQLFGEFAPGTKVHPTGNYTSPPGPFEPIHDKARVKFNWSLKCPEGAPPDIKDQFHNQVITLFKAIDDEDRHGRKHWITQSLSDDDSDLIHIATTNLFQNATAKPVIRHAKILAF
ncbi:hypothetical protein K435DRAFT_875486 [Dendrothele bispora CBS 962.96]|uniref:Uncharacterized protein n=1 Tax=Dendrothele bispora (strain CBS 962.96) TaxID=1314807 RepID=A0A4S8KU61_DENBC|nr:hypothetical protein K435DRAFT_875486 [Dendrothele bispora CBS 962.96]